VRLASAVDEVWLSDRIQAQKSVRFNEDRQAVEAVVERRLGAIVFESKADSAPDPAQVQSLLLAEAHKDPRRALNPSNEIDTLLLRIAFLRAHADGLSLPQTDLHAILEAACAGKKSFADLRAVDLKNLIHAHIGYDKVRLVEEHAPERIEVPTKSQIRLRYEASGPPVLAVRLQEVFGMEKSPTVAMGRVPVKMELLAPNMRPVQVTQDLASFWTNTYPEVRKDLRGRYPKHAWPEDPRAAQPQRGAKRRRK